MKLYAKLEGDLGEVSSKDFLSTLKGLKIGDDATRQGNGVVVRMHNDDEYFSVMGDLNMQVQRAANGSQLIGGGAVFVWLVVGTVYTDGDGWRMVLVPQALQTQQPQPPPPSRLRLP